jgi:PIN domain nuclease of toxin-antitoxin system
VPTISIFEVTELAQRGRLEFRLSARAWVREALRRPRVHALALTPAIALDAAQLQFDGNPADRIIYATARVERAPLVTRDERIRAFDPDSTVW